MNEEISKLKRDNEVMKQQIADLQSALSIAGMPYELKEIIRNEVIKQEDSTQALTRTEIISDTPTSITVPVNPTGTLVLKWRGKEYKIFYV
jgi:hypothetical protein